MDEPCKPCAKKQKIPLMTKTGAVQVIYRCTETKADAYAKDVGAAQCNGCPFRVDPPKLPIVLSVDVVAKPKKTQPSIKIVGQTDIDNYKPCDYRRQQTIIKCCGEVIYRRVCSCPNCEYNQKEVLPTDCSKCPLRVVNSVAVFNPKDGS